MVNSFPICIRSSVGFYSTVHLSSKTRIVIINFDATCRHHQNLRVISKNGLQIRDQYKTTIRLDEFFRCWSKRECALLISICLYRETITFSAFLFTNNCFLFTQRHSRDFTAFTVPYLSTQWRRFWEPGVQKTTLNWKLDIELMQLIFHTLQLDLDFRIALVTIRDYDFTWGGSASFRWKVAAASNNAAHKYVTIGPTDESTATLVHFMKENIGWKQTTVAHHSQSKPK